MKFFEHFRHFSSRRCRIFYFPHCNLKINKYEMLFLCSNKRENDDCLQLVNVRLEVGKNDR